MRSRTKAPVQRTAELDREIEEFYKKDPAAIAAELKTAKINPQPTIDAITHLMKEKFSGRDR